MVAVKIELVSATTRTDICYSVDCQLYLLLNIFAKYEAYNMNSAIHKVKNRGHPILTREEAQRLRKHKSSSHSYLVLVENKSYVPKTLKIPVLSTNIDPWIISDWAQIFLVSTLLHVSVYAIH